MKKFFISLLFFNILTAGCMSGLDCFFPEHAKELKNKKIGLITNHTGKNKELKSTIDLFIENAKDYKIQAVFTPEHGFFGQAHASEKISDNHYRSIPIFSLYGKNRRPTDSMLNEIDLLIFDIQDIGSRSYTYITTLFYVMEKAAKKNIKVMILDRPNPLGEIVDGPLLDSSRRSFIGYINVPYCHGMTVGELACFFNEEYNVGVQLNVIKMKQWKRSFIYSDTKLPWVPLSPQIPEPDTPFYYPTTGILGELNLVNIGIGYTLPFKVVGAPWIDAECIAEKMNEQKLPGVFFLPFHYTPFFGLYKGKECHGMKIVITDHQKFKPLTTQFLLMGMIKSLYPKKVLSKLNSGDFSKDLFCKAAGTDRIFNLFKEEQYPGWKMIESYQKDLDQFIKIRKKYLFSEYE